MQINLTQIGNSKGFRIPQSILKQCNFSSTASLEVLNQQLVISPTKPRQNWNQQFTQANPSPNKPKFDFTNDWDNQEWQW